ncbi:MAG TPA: hypothetical protein VMU83_12825 [Hanamia sp.]|nr:hypothetical protein [Hanamia sp.]
MELVNKYEQVRALYQQNFESKFSSENLFEYNEVLFSTHSCAIEGTAFQLMIPANLKNMA